MIKLIQEFNQLSNLQQIYFLSLIEKSFLLLEGIKSAREKYLDEIGEDKFNELIKIDPSKNKKYLDWICKEYLNGVDIERLKNNIKLFDEKCNKNLIDNKDIYFYNNIDELENVLNQSPDISNTAKRKEIKKNPNKEKIEILPDVKVLRNDDKYFIAEIHSWEDAKFYGKGTKWCISEKDSDESWKNYYRNEGNKFIYIRNFKYPDLGMNSNKNYKLMIQSLPKSIMIFNNINNKIYSEFICNVWDALDRSIEYSIEELSKRFGIKEEDIFNGRIIDMGNIDFNTKEGIEDWLKKMGVYSSTINDDLTVDIHVGDVNLRGKGLIEIPVQFGYVNGDFDCSGNYLTSLKGAPKKVNGWFNCSDNNLKSLEGAPKIVNGYFDCSWNKLTLLEGAPRRIDNGNFYCSRNSLKLLKGAPKIVNGDFYCSFNPNLESLEGHPKYVGKNFYCKNTPKLSKEYLDNFDFSFVNGDVYYD